MDTTQHEPTAEELFGIAMTATRFVTLNPPPADTSVSIAVRNYDGQDRYPNLDGVTVGIHVATADGSWVEGLRAALFGVAASEPHVIDYDFGRVTSWADSFRCEMSWTAPLPAVVSA